MPPTRATFSVLLLTKNAQDKLPGCLESVRWADEVVMVDGQSTDRTREIGQGFGAKIIERPFSGSFAEERNAGLQAATGDWVIQMDADERVSAGLRQTIERLLSDPQVPYAAFQVRRKNYFLGHWMRYGGWYHHHLCLFRRAGARYDGLVHERLTVDGPIGVLEADLEHYPFDSLSQFINRQNRYTSLQAQEIVAQRSTVSDRQIRYQLTVRPLKLFWKFYVKKQGFRDGLHGLVFSCLYAWVHVMIWTKVWEQTRHGDAS
jgi:glycosyltransferase involved in cell wall biosynthesis